MCVSRCVAGFDVIAAFVGGGVGFVPSFVVIWLIWKEMLRLVLLFVTRNRCINGTVVDCVDIPFIHLDVVFSTLEGWRIRDHRLGSVAPSPVRTFDFYRALGWFGPLPSLVDFFLLRILLPHTRCFPLFNTGRTAAHGEILEPGYSSLVGVKGTYHC